MNTFFGTQAQVCFACNGICLLSARFEYISMCAPQDAASESGVVTVVRRAAEETENTADSLLQRLLALPQVSSATLGYLCVQWPMPARLDNTKALPRWQRRLQHQCRLRHAMIRGGWICCSSLHQPPLLWGHRINLSFTLQPSSRSWTPIRLMAAFSNVLLNRLMCRETCLQLYSHLAKRCCARQKWAIETTASLSQRQAC